jgi:hypothetical protein
MAKTLISLTVVTLAFGTAFMGCGSADGTEAATTEMSDIEPVSEPAETTAEPEPATEPAETWDEAAGETEIVALDAEALIRERCTFCHDADRVYKAGLSRAGWEDTIDRMVARGAWLDETEREAVIKYLSEL